MRKDKEEKKNDFKEREREREKKNTAERGLIDFPLFTDCLAA